MPQLAFRISAEPLNCDDLRNAMNDPASGALVTFIGRVRDHNFGRAVSALDYEAYEEMCDAEAGRILAEAAERWDVRAIHVVHRVGRLAVGEPAVWIGVSTGHRAGAFACCEFMIDSIKVRLPIWKKETFLMGHSAWVNCPGCSARAPLISRRISECEHLSPAPSD